MVLKLETGSRLVCATHNPGKAKELSALLEGRFTLVTAKELGLEEPEEVETSFVGNAVLKARTAANASGLIAIADDSGLSVTALGGAPGIYSARWAETEHGRNFPLAIERVRRELQAANGADHAFFTAALAVAWPQGPVVAVEGRVDGRLVFPPRGDRGFGYDPIFVPEGETLTFGEMDPARKDELSHRARAFETLAAALL